MKIEHLEGHISDYKASIETVIKKKNAWKSKTKQLLLKVLNGVTEKYDVGWRVQELNWIHNNEAVNITFDSFPQELLEKTNCIPSYQFIQGAALVFSQSYNGDVFVFIVFPIIDYMSTESNSVDLGVYSPLDINENLIIEKVDEFLKEMIAWEVPAIKNKMGYKSH